MTHITQTSQFAALKRVLWFMERRKKDYPDDRIFPDVSFSVLKAYVEDQERQAARDFEKEKKVAELGRENKIISFKKNGVIYVPCKNCPDSAEKFISTTRHPKIINGKVVCNEKRKLAFNGIKWAIDNGYIPEYESSISSQVLHASNVPAGHSGQ